MTELPRLTNLNRKLKMLRATVYSYRGRGVECLTRCRDMMMVVMVTIMMMICKLQRAVRAKRQQQQQHSASSEYSALNKDGRCM